jgi:serine/threonine protein kinase
MAGARPLGPGSVLGPGQLGRHYRITDTINTIDGTFAEVFTVTLEPPPPHPKTWAVKVSRGGGEDRGGWVHEIRVMQRVRDAACPHLAAVRDYFADAATGRLCIVMERYEDSLQGVLEQGPDRPTARVVWGWAEDMARGLAVLHELGIIHTDLELRNVFLNAEGRAVLGDFGTSLFIRGLTTGGVRPSGAPLKLAEDSPMTPPEVRKAYVDIFPLVGLRNDSALVTALIDARLSPQADVWALGGVLLQLLMGPRRDLTPAVVEQLAGIELPARERALREKYVFNDGRTREGVEGMYADQLVGLIARVLTLDPALRPSALDLLVPPNPDPPRVGERVVARPTLLERLKRAVLPGGGGAVVATSTRMNRRKVWGMGGVGKTTLAKMLMAEADVRAASVTAWRGWCWAMRAPA